VWINPSLYTLYSLLVCSIVRDVFIRLGFIVPQYMLLMSALTSLVYSCLLLFLERQVQIVSAVIPAYTHSIPTQSLHTAAYPYNTILLVDMVHTFMPTCWTFIKRRLLPLGLMRLMRLMLRLHQWEKLVRADYVDVSLDHSLCFVVHRRIGHRAW
jgi:hypothetical protein